MASKILHRIRRTIVKEGNEEGTQQEKTEEFPEISELVDDMEGLSTHLSGKLSFGSDPLYSNIEEMCPEEEDMVFVEHEDDYDDESLNEPRNEACSFQGGISSCNLLTRQLQESWKKSRIRIVQEKLCFEATQASVVQEGSSRYVLYTVHLIKSGRFDRNPGSITRRYSDFEKLNRLLRKLFKSHMADITFPRKKLHKNFASDTIAGRSRAFEQYLSHLYSVPEIRCSPVFLQFFYLPDLTTGQELLRSGHYKEAMGNWSNAFHLQDKLGGRDLDHQIVTLAALTVCSQELDRLKEAQEYCERALQLLEKHDQHPFLGPLLQSNIRLCWKITKDKRQSEAWLQQLQDNGLEISNLPSLKELLIKEQFV
ncbi:sorting nexin-21-like [Protopterus annectens]|uniref:sorting nexin-21-like n=1 Tax=Protopterus annectens TaxID=7888 RepID=UPI001CF9B2DA|nr:sorting nexin-21-like [Protopterus annectens]